MPIFASCALQVIFKDSKAGGLRLKLAFRPDEACKKRQYTSMGFLGTRCLLHTQQSINGENPSVGLSTYQHHPAIKVRVANDGLFVASCKFHPVGTQGPNADPRF